MSRPGDARRTRAWRKLRDQVVSEEPLCWLRYPTHCTTLSTTADHVIPVDLRPDLAMDRANLRGACQPCNRQKSNRVTAPAEPARALTFFG